MPNIFFYFFIFFVSSNLTFSKQQEKVELLVKLEKTQENSHFFQFFLRNKIFWKKLEIEKALKLNNNENKKKYLLVQSIIKSIPIIIFQFLFIFFLWLLIKKIFFEEKKTKILIMYLLLIIIIFLILKSEWEDNFNQHAIVITENAKIYTGPSDDFSDIGSLKAGEKGSIELEKDGFYKINFKQQLGWIKSEHIKTI